MKSTWHEGIWACTQGPQSKMMSGKIFLQQTDQHRHAHQSNTRGWRLGCIGFPIMLLNERRDDEPTRGRRQEGRATYMNGNQPPSSRIGRPPPHTQCMRLGLCGIVGGGGASSGCQFRARVGEFVASSGRSGQTNRDKPTVGGASLFTKLNFGRRKFKHEP